MAIALVGSTLRSQVPNFVHHSGAMKGVSIVHDETKKKRYVQIDMDLIGKDPDQVIDQIDLLVIEARRNEPTIPIAEVKRRLERSRRK